MRNHQKAVAVTGHSTGKKAPAHPSQAIGERQHAGEGRLDRAKTSRQAKGEDAQSKGPAPLLVEVVRYRGHWRTLHNRKHSSPLPDQAAAIAAAKSLAREKQERGHAVEVRLVRTDGKVILQPLDDQRDE